MRTILCSFIFLFFSAVCGAAEINLDSLYRTLDDAIRHSADYEKVKQENIEKMLTRLRATSDPNMRFLLSHNLYEEYHAFINDSALYYLAQCVSIAEQMSNKALAGKVRSELAFQCSNTGMYEESLLVLDSVEVSYLERPGQAAYYRAKNHVYSEMAVYGRIPQMQRRFREEAKKYEKMMLSVLDSMDVRALQRKEITLMNEGKNDSSLLVNDMWMKQVDKGTHPYALCTFYRYLEYKSIGDSIRMMYWLTESALSDVRNAVMDQGSMWELANLLMSQGDIDRAYRYISFACDCATRFGTRLRAMQLSPILSAIDSKYREYHEREKQRARIFIGVLGLFSLVLAFSLYEMVRQHRRLRAAHTRMYEQNGQLSALNEQLSTLNSQLSSANSHLSQSNSMKEEYVGHFMRLCSMYIDKMDTFRKRMNRMVKNRDYDALYQLTRGQEFRDKELEDLYASFDSAFLHLFPNFVNDFNALLRPEAQIDVENNDRLNTGIRIFALIRLGIDDSSKIAEFLHYSVNTIYNYRARIKNEALGDRDTFEQRVKELGALE